MARLSKQVKDMNFKQDHEKQQHITVANKNWRRKRKKKIAQELTKTYTICSENTPLLMQNAFASAPSTTTCFPSENAWTSLKKQGRPKMQ